MTKMKGLHDQTHNNHYSATHLDYHMVPVQCVTCGDFSSSQKVIEVSNYLDAFYRLLCSVSFVLSEAGRTTVSMRRVIVASLWNISLDPPLFYWLGRFYI